MLYLVGLGLYDITDITVRGLNIVKSCNRVYLEAYTSILGVEKNKLEEYYERDVLLADRDLVEQGAEEILHNAETEDVALLVVGDPFGATTHTDFILRAAEKGIPYQVIHNASIMTAIGCCGLQLYNFGETVSIVFWTETWRPESYYDKIAANRDRGMHTLCLLDIKVKEQSIENLARGRKIYEPPRYMSVNQAAEQLLEIVSNRRSRGQTLAFTENTLCVGLARVAANDQKIISGTLSALTSANFGAPLHSLIVVGKVHPLEVDMLKLFAETKEDIETYAELIG
ncbi:diphthine methyl ester synthase-like [Watersipora subatra]|uniref:diphthine methyl ester synthase-like n=1 Tax=Watersipora subatra TaxID=2589382 RepID=UPI00355BFBA5